MKIKRQSKIIEIIKENNIETQEEIAAILKKAGYNATQATISRDIRELKLTKIISESGRQRYSVMASEDNENTKKFNRIFKDGVISLDYAQNIIVIKTLNGMAMAVAAVLDNMNNGEIIGSIAGDDTIFCVVKNEEKALKILDKLKNILKLDRKEV